MVPYKRILHFQDPLHRCGAQLQKCAWGLLNCRTNLQPPELLFILVLLGKWGETLSLPVVRHYGSIIQAETAGGAAAGKCGVTAAAEFWTPRERPPLLTQGWAVHQKRSRNET